MSCKHQPVITFKLLFARKPKFVCRHCGARIEMEPKFRTISQVVNTIFIVVLIYKAFSGGKTSTGADLSQLFINLGIMLGIILAYIIAQILFMRFSTYRELPPEEETPAEPEKTEEAEAKPQYTEEQQELMAMYAEVERKAKIAAGENPDEVKPAEISVEEEDTCVHTPVKSWKNFIPSKYDFKCEHCGKPITFTAAGKKQMNMFYLVIMFVVLMPTFTNNNVKFWQFGLLTLLVLALGVVIQFYFVKKAKFILKQPGQK